LADVELSGRLRGDSDLRFVNLSDNERAKYSLSSGDLLIFRVNGSRAITGQMATYDGPPDYAYCDHFIRARLAPGFTPSFVSAQFKQGPPRQAVEEGMVTTAGQNTVSQGTMGDVVVRCAPEREQRRIVAKLDELGARSRRAKESMDAVPALIDKLRQSILAAAFRGDLTADWRAKNPDVEPADKLLARIRAERRARWEAAELAKLTAKGKPPADDGWRKKYKEPEPLEPTDLPDIPKSWCWTSVDESFFEAKIGLVRSTAEQGSTGVPYIRMQHFNERGQWQLEDVTRVTVTDGELTEYALREGDILFNTRNSAELVGKVALWPAEPTPHVYNNNLMRLRAAGSLPAWMAWQMVAPGFRRRIARFVSATTSVAAIYGRDFFRQGLCVPPIAEQKAIIERLHREFSTIAVIAQHACDSTRALDLLEQSVLSRAFAGELVAQDPNDEPAPVLLDRIRNARGDASTLRRPRRAPLYDETTEPATIEPRAVAPLISAPLLEPDGLGTRTFAALWLHGPLDKDVAVRRLADHLRDAGLVTFQRLRADGPLYTQLADAIDAAVKAGHLDRPKRGQVRACKPDATAYTADDWRYALLAVLSPSPTDRDDAIRAAAEWARDNCGLEFTRLRADGHIVTGLRSALNSAIRAKLITRIDATRIARAPDSPADRQTTLFES